MSTSPNLNLPFVAAGQAQKHVTVNEGLVAIDSLMHLSVEAAPSGTLPVEPAEGSRWIVGEGPSGAWSGRSGDIAAWLDGGWRFHTPRIGWLVHVASERTLLAFNGAAWAPLADPIELNNLSRLGIGIEAETVRRLSVASPTTLLTHEGSDHRLVINKAASPDTASLVFQTDWTGHAEVGLTGNDGLSFKVSADGMAWTEALRLERASGAVTGRFFDSVQLVVGTDQVGVVEPPSKGGIVFLSLVDNNYPQNPAACILAYDVGASPALTTMVGGSAVENKGTRTLTGTTSTAGKVGVAVDGSGHLFIENRYSGGLPYQFCLAFVNSWRQL